MFSKIIKNILQCSFFILAGAVLFAFSNPNPLIKHGFAFTAWIMYVPYFFLIKKSTIKNCWAYSGIYGILSVGLYAYWIYNYNPLCLKISLIIAFIGMALFGSLLKVIEMYFKKHSWLIQYLAICTFEYLRTLGFLGFHYGLAAYSQWNMPLIVQSLRVVGVFGLNAFVIFSSAAVFAFLSKFRDKKIILNKMISDNKHYDGATYVNYVSENERLLENTSIRLPVILSCVWIVLFIAMLIYGSVVRKTNNYETVTVAAIQHDDDPNETGIENYREAVQRLITLTDEALEINPDIDFVIWPETAVVPSIMYYYNQTENSERKKLVSYLLNYIQNRSPVFVIGNQHIVVNSDGSNRKYFNSSLTFDHKTSVIPPEPYVYSKIHLVPFSESFPYEKYLPHIYKALLENVKFFWNEGEEISVIKTGGLSFYTPICFEDTFPDLCRKAYKNGARCFFSLTNDSWSASESCQYQHLAMAKFRAVENSVPVVISAVSGQTAIIDSHGNITEMAVPFTKSYAVGQVQVIPDSQKPTIYNKIGDIFGYGIAFLLLCVLLIRFFIVIIHHIHLWQSAQK